MFEDVKVVIKSCILERTDNTMVKNIFKKTDIRQQNTTQKT